MSNETREIPELTAEQKTLLEHYFEKWIGYGKCNDPCNIEASLPAVHNCYKSAGLPVPEVFYHFQSPMGAAMGVAMMLSPNWDKISQLSHTYYQLLIMIDPTQIKKRVIKRPDLDPRFDQVTKLSGQAQLEYAAKLKDEIYNEYRQLHDQTSAPGMETYWKHVEEALAAQNPGAHDAGWLAFFSFVRDVLGMKQETELAAGHIDLAQNCGWWTAYPNCFILQDRHVHCHRDEQNRLHCENDLALKYRDGFGLWVIDGIRVNKQIVMAPETQTPEDFLNETDMDVRAIRGLRYPWPRLLAELKASPLDSRGNETEGTYEALYAYKDRQGREERRFLYTCATGRLMSSGVGPEVNTCESAQKWLGNNRKRNIIGRT